MCTGTGIICEKYVEQIDFHDFELCILSSVESCGVEKMDIVLQCVFEKLSVQLAVYLLTYMYKISITILQYLMMMILLLYQNPKIDIDPPLMCMCSTDGSIV